MPLCLGQGMAPVGMGVERAVVQASVVGTGVHSLPVQVLEGGGTGFGIPKKEVIGMGVVPGVGGDAGALGYPASFQGFQGAVVLCPALAAANLDRVYVF